jgi:hypothetical protein
MELKDVLAMQVGERRQILAFGREFWVKRLRRNCWHLRATHIESHSRFGTAREITEDLERVVECGVLPYYGARW